MCARATALPMHGTSAWSVRASPLAAARANVRGRGARSPPSPVSARGPPPTPPHLHPEGEEEPEEPTTPEDNEEEMSVETDDLAADGSDYL